MKRIQVLILVMTFLIACKKEKEQNPQIPQSGESSVIILNEGNFRSANASVDIYYPNDHSLQEGVFSSNNQSRPLGDVAQSMSLINGEYWLVVNNSAKIETLDPATFRATGQISGLNSPRYCQQINSEKVYVSDLYEDKIYVVNANTKSIMKTINTNGWIEEMLLYKDLLFACHMDSNQIYVFNTLNDSLIQKINTYEQPHSIELDANASLWVACSGGYQSSQPALHKIDPNNFQIVKTHSINDINLSIGDIALSRSGRELYFLMEGLYRMNVNDSILPTVPFIAENNRNFYAMDVNASNDDIYIADAIDYQQRGDVYRYDANANLIYQFKSGLIPGFFYFAN